MSSFTIKCLIIIFKPFITGFLTYILLMHILYKPFANFIKYIKVNRGESWDEQLFKRKVMWFIITMILVMITDSLEALDRIYRFH